MTTFLDNLLFDMATTFFRPFTAMKRGWFERLGRRYFGAAWALVLCLLAWGFLLSDAVKNNQGSNVGIEFYLASVVLILWSITTSYAALLVLAMFVISALRKPKSR
jgi:FtsH-binding integral membrane protein